MVGSGIDEAEIKDNINLGSEVMAIEYAMGILEALLKGYGTALE